MQLIQTVTAAVTDAGLSPARKPSEEFVFRFRVTCQLIDHYAGMEEPDSSKSCKYFIKMFFHKRNN